VLELPREMYHRLVHGTALIKFAVVHRHIARTPKGRVNEYGRILFLVPKEFINQRVLVIVIPVSEIITNMPWWWLFGKVKEMETESEVTGEELDDGGG